MTTRRPDERRFAASPTAVTWFAFAMLGIAIIIRAIALLTVLR